MPGLDRHHRCSDLDALGDLPEQSHGRHRIEVAGNLGNPERRETVALGGLSVVEKPGQPVGTRAFLVGADHQADPHEEPPTAHSDPIRAGRRGGRARPAAVRRRPAPPRSQHRPQPFRRGQRVVVEEAVRDRSAPPVALASLASTSSVVGRPDARHTVDVEQTGLRTHRRVPAAGTRPSPATTAARRRRP